MRVALQVGNPLLKCTLVLPVLTIRAEIGHLLGNGPFWLGPHHPSEQINKQGARLLEPTWLMPNAS